MHSCLLHQLFVGSIPAQMPELTDVEDAQYVWRCIVASVGGVLSVFHTCLPPTHRHLPVMVGFWVTHEWTYLWHRYLADHLHVSHEDKQAYKLLQVGWLVGWCDCWCCCVSELAAHSPKH